MSYAGGYGGKNKCAKGIGKGSAADSMYAPSFVGTVKSYNPQSGWGMITCDMTNQLYGKDVFFSKSAAPPQGVSAGEQVRFSVKMEPKGPAALEVTPLAQMYAPAPMPMPMVRPAPQPFYGGMKGGSPGFFKQPSTNTVYCGVVKSFHEDKGWGHIGCEATMKIYGKDVFVLREKLNGTEVAPGYLVCFKVTMGAKGPQAADVIVLPEGSVGMDGQSGNQFSGTIKSFNAEKGWGFVTGEEIQSAFGKDMFINKREFGDYTPTPGEQVQFYVELDNDGQLQAKHIEFGAGDASQQAKRQKLGY